MYVENLLNRLHKVRKNGTDKWMACCPAHDDRSPSLAIAERNGKILLHCFAGCELPEILGSIDMELSDLYPDQDHRSVHRETPDAVARRGREILRQQENQLQILENQIAAYKQGMKRGIKYKPAEHENMKRVFLKLQELRGV